MKKTNAIVENRKGVALGLLIINLVVAVSAFFLISKLWYLSLFSAAIISFVPFLFLQFSSNPLLKQKYWIGMIVAFLGGFLTSIFYSNYYSINTSKVTIESVTKLDAKDIHNTKDSVIHLSNYKVMLDVEGLYHNKLRDQSENYVVYPIVPKTWKSGDSVIVWAGFSHNAEIFGKTKAEFIRQIKSSNSLAFHIRNEYELKKYERALYETGFLHGLKIRQHSMVFKFVDAEMERIFWLVRFVIGMFVINGLWLFITIPLINKLKDNTEELKEVVTESISTSAINK